MNFEHIFRYPLESDLISQLYLRYFEYFPTFILGVMVTLILTPIIGYLARKHFILNDTINQSRNRLNRHENIERRINPNPVPLLGGLAILIPLLILIPLAFGFTPLTTPLIVALLLLTITGIVDDIYNLPATVQFLAQFFASLIVASSVLDIEVVHLPILGALELDWATFATQIGDFPLSFVFPGDLLMVFWIMVVINAVKWVGGIDALMEGNLALAFALLYVIGIRNENLIIILMSVYMFGAMLGFIFYNFPPARIFTGSSGKTAFGFLIAVMSIINDTKVALTIMIILLPLADFIYVLFKRLRSSTPRTLGKLVKLPLNLMRQADTNHLHHTLLKLGLSVRQILLVELSISLLVGVVAVSSTEAYRLSLVFLLFFLIFSLITAIHIISRRKALADQRVELSKPDSPESKYSY